MKENTSQQWIDAHDAAWEEFAAVVKQSMQRGVVPPSKWEAFAAGFSAGVAFGRANPEPTQ